MAEAEKLRVHAFVETQLDRLASEVEKKLDADVMAIIGPLFSGVDSAVREAIETRKQEQEELRKGLAILLDTDGGIIEVVERMVHTIRHHYAEVTMIVANQAMSAGTVFAMSGDRIMMDYFACLGPIDPQVKRNDKLVPALSYLVQFERLKERAASGEITTAEMVLLQQLDLAELHSFEEARELSNTLLKEWLAKYKFKDWKVTETKKETVTSERREQRALEIAQKLMDHQRWHSHGRPIPMEVLRRELNLKIDDFGEDAELSRFIREYREFLDDYMSKIGVYGVVHTRGVCLKA
ncbi:MAG: ATP-dependent Clp protease proteolytic subunit [Gemmataceae bacterium]|nr:ATP-dependent Clp protease proteolytic subunit [Gemmataceae bacterium]